DSDLPSWKRALARIIDRVAPTFALKNDFDAATLSRDRTVGERYVIDPLNEHRTTTHLAVLAFDEQARVRAAAASLSIPTLVYHGQSDELVPPSASEPLAALPTVTRRVYPRLRHD